jgi:hypothetical protein
MRKSRTARDAGLRQVSTATKWIAGAAAVLTGFITVWEARSVNHAGATTPATPPATSPAVVQPPSSPGGTDSGSSASPNSGNNSGGYSGGNLQAPDAAPTPSYQQPSAHSGGS